MTWLSLLSSTQPHVLSRSSSAALSDGRDTLSYLDLPREISRRADWLRMQAPTCVALCLNNGIEWILFDMACAEAGIPCIPVPGFFSAEQRQHALQSAGADVVLADNAHASNDTTAFEGVFMVPSPVLSSVGRTGVLMPEGTQKITFTSGSTGRPRGVCLSYAQQAATAMAVAEAVNIDQPVHLCALPLATLLENIAGVYAPLLRGGTVYVPSGESLGFTGSRLTAPDKFLQGIHQFKPGSLILVPELLLFLVNAVGRGWRPPASLRFIAVGGARVSPTLLAQAGRAGLPVFQGYGLSECGSVVTLNTPASNCVGAIGKPLAHVQTDIHNNELWVRGNTFLGYLDDPASWYPDSVRTGDLVHEDAHGVLWFDGRRRNQLISSFGRNISPEWPEAELLSDGALRQAVVVGDDRPHCIAIVAPFMHDGKPTLDAHTLPRWLQAINRRLPDYAQIKQCLVLAQPMTAARGLMTDNGRPNRAAIQTFFQPAVDALYRSNACVDYYTGALS